MFVANPFEWFGHVIITIVTGLVSLFLVLAAIAIVFLFVRFLLVATRAAQIYVAQNTPAKPAAPTPTVTAPATTPAPTAPAPTPAPTTTTVAPGPSTTRAAAAKAPATTKPAAKPAASKPSAAKPARAPKTPPATPSA